MSNDLSIALTNLELFSVEGDLTNVSIADVIGGGAHFAVAKQLVNVSSPSLTDAKLLTFTLSALALSTPFGLTISGGTVQFASLTPAAPADPRRWSAISIQPCSCGRSAWCATASRVHGLTAGRRSNRAS